jgi:hypothetical protein
MIERSWSEGYFITSWKNVLLLRLKVGKACRKKFERYGNTYNVASFPLFYFQIPNFLREKFQLFNGRQHRQHYRVPAVEKA